jgi:two-component system, OmpR family, sensor histidine kinase KdpD
LRGTKASLTLFSANRRARWEILLHGSVINRFLAEVRDATVQVVPVEEPEPNKVDH